MEHGFFNEALGARLANESMEVLYRCVNEIRENHRKSSSFYVDMGDLKRRMANRGLTVTPRSVKEALLKVETGSGQRLFLERAPGVLFGESEDWDELYRAHTSGIVGVKCAYDLLNSVE